MTALAIVVLPLSEPGSRRNGGLDWGIQLCAARGLEELDPRTGRSEGWLVAADTGGGPRVGGRSAATLRCAALGSARLGRRPRVVVGRAGLTAALLPTAVRRTARALGARHLGGGVLQRRTDLVDLDLEDGALLALTRLVLTRAQVALHDDAHPLLEGLRDVLRGLRPHRAGEEQRFAVLPLVGLAVEGARRGGDPEVGHRGARGREAELRVVDQVADHGDLGVACHVRTPREGCSRVGSSWLSPPTSARADPQVVSTRSTTAELDHRRVSGPRAASP